MLLKINYSVRTRPKLVSLDPRDPLRQNRDVQPVLCAASQRLRTGEWRDKIGVPLSWVSAKVVCLRGRLPALKAVGNFWKRYLLSTGPAHRWPMICPVAPHRQTQPSPYSPPVSHSDRGDRGDTKHCRGQAGTRMSDPEWGTHRGGTHSAPLTCPVATQAKEGSSRKSRIFC